MMWEKLSFSLRARLIAIIMYMIGNKWLMYWSDARQLYTASYTISDNIYMIHLVTYITWKQ